ncbi:thiol:disulfide interchange protein DsbA/DsbL [Luteimonas sp. A501]
MIQRLIPVLLMLALAVGTVLPSTARADDGLVEGRDYVAISNGQPFKAEAGKVEVVEVFAYWCHVCNDFQPHVTRWQRTLADDVAFRYLPAAFTPGDPYARAYFGMDSLDAPAGTHEAIFRAIHVEQALPQRGASVDEFATLFGELGLDRTAAIAAMRSPEADAGMASSRDFIIATGIQGTPSMIVNGRYRVLGRNFGDMLRITDLLVARERAATSDPSVSAPDEPTP